MISSAFSLKARRVTLGKVPPYMVRIKYDIIHHPWFTGKNISMTKWGSTCQVIVKFGHIFNIGDWLEKFLNKIGLVRGLLGRVEKRLGKGQRERLLPESCCLRVDTTTRIGRGVVDIRLRGRQNNLELIFSARDTYVRFFKFNFIF